MGIYIGIEILLILALFQKRYRNLSYYYLLLILTALAAFRGVSVGADTRAYVEIYNSYASKTWLESLANPNYSFALYCKALNELGASGRGFIVISSILFTILLAKALEANKCDKILSLALFYLLGLYIQSFCIIRQSFACVIFLIGYAHIDEVKEEKVRLLHVGKFAIGKVGNITFSVKYLIFMIIAIGFHTSAIFFLLLPLCIKYYHNLIRYNPKMFLKNGLVLLCLALLFFSAFGLVVFKLLPDKYINLYGNMVGLKFNNITSALLLGIVYLVFYFCYKNHYSDLTNSDKIKIGAAITVSMALISMSMVSPALGRINLYSESMMVVSMDKLLKEKHSGKRSKDIIYIGFFSTYFILYLFRDSINVVPYFLF